MNRTTHTYAILVLSSEAFKEIKMKLEAAGYSPTFEKIDGQLRIPMNGISVVEEKTLPVKKNVGRNCSGS